MQVTHDLTCEILTHGRLRSVRPRAHGSGSSGLSHGWPWKITRDDPDPWTALVGTNNESFRDQLPHDSDEEEPYPPTGNAGTGAPVTVGDIATLMTFLSCLKIPNSGIPIPSSTTAPWFKGCHLQKFLEDYEFVAENIGWTNAQKCEHLYKYCRLDTQELVWALEPCKKGNWFGTIHMLQQLYGSGDWMDKYSRESLECLVAQSREITKKKEFTKYYWEFNKHCGRCLQGR